MYYIRFEIGDDGIWHIVPDEKAFLDNMHTGGEMYITCRGAGWKPALKDYVEAHGFTAEDIDNYPDSISLATVRVVGW